MDNIIHNIHVLYDYLWKQFAQYTVHTQIKCPLMCHFIWIFTVCKSIWLTVSSHQWVNNFISFTFSHSTDTSTLRFTPTLWTKMSPSLNQVTMMDLKNVSDVIATKGVVLTGLNLLHIISFVIWFPERRRLPRMWILLGIHAAHFIHLILINVQEGLVRSIHDTGSGNAAECTCVAGMRPFLECTSVFGSDLLA